MLVSNMGDKTKSILDIAIAIKTIYKDLMGIELPIIEMVEESTGSANDLFFESRVMESQGFKWESNYTHELTKLIEFSEHNVRGS